MYLSDTFPRPDIVLFRARLFSLNAVPSFPSPGCKLCRAAWGNAVSRLNNL